MATNLSADLISGTGPLPAGVSISETSRGWKIRRALELWIPVGILALIAFMCFIWPEIHAVPSPTLGHFSSLNVPPFSPHFLLGTDPLGEDEFSRLLYGGRVSLEVGFGSAALGMAVGSTLGIAAGYKGGAIDMAITRLIDIFLSFPALILAIVVAAYLGPNVINLIWAIAFFTIPAFTRLSRANTLAVRGLDFVTAAKLSGSSDRRIMFKHVLPNVFPKLLTFVFLTVGVAIIVEASLSFLGLGIVPPQPSWGNMIQVGQEQIYSDRSLLLIPSAALFLTILSLNLLSDAVRSRWSG